MRTNKKCVVFSSYYIEFVDFEICIECIRFIEVILLFFSLSIFHVIKKPQKFEVIQFIDWKLHFVTVFIFRISQ